MFLRNSRAVGVFLFSGLLSLVFFVSCGEVKKVSGRYVGVRNSPVESIEFRAGRAVLTTSGMLRLVFELDYVLKKDMLYLKDPANGLIPFKIVSSSELLCRDCAYGAKFRKKSAPHAAPGLMSRKK